MYPKMSDPQRATFCDSLPTYQAALRRIFAGQPSTTAADLAAIFTPTFTQRDNDTTRDFPAFVEHIRWVREVTGGDIGDIDVVQFLRDGNQLAERHVNKTTMPDGRPVESETFMFVEVAEDGRIEKVVELVKRVYGGDAPEVVV